MSAGRPREMAAREGRASPPRTMAAHLAFTARRSHLAARSSPLAEAAARLSTMMISRLLPQRERHVTGFNGCGPHEQSLDLFSKRVVILN